MHAIWEALVAVFGRIFGSMRDAISACFGGVVGEEPISKSLVAIWCIAGIGIWYHILQGARGADLLLSAIVLTLGSCFALYPAKTIISSLEHLHIRLVASAVFWTTLFFVSMIAGDWEKADKIDFVCFGTFHLHHWFKSAIGATIFALLPPPMLADDKMPHSSAKRLIVWITCVYTLAVILWGIAALSWMDFYYFPGNKSLQLEFAILGALFFFSAMAASAREEVGRRWFRLHIAISISIQLAIFAQGGVGILRDFVKGEAIPSSFIFFNDKANCPGD